MWLLCIKWGDKYGEEYVRKLASMCARHFPAHNFVCITEKPIDGIRCHPLLCDLPGWWQKVGLLKPGVFPGPKFYIDLDTLVTAPVELPPLADKLWALDDFSYSLRNPKPLWDPHVERLLGGVGTINSSCLYWQDYVGAKAWTTFSAGVMKELHGDQNWITRALWPDEIELFPPGFAVSWRYNYSQGQRAPIVVFHGEPKPHDLRGDVFVAEHWR